MTHWETKREILCDELDVTLRHRAPYTLSLFKVSIAQLNPCRANNNQKSAQIEVTGHPRVLAVAFMVGSTLFQDNKEIDPWLPK